MLARMLLGIVVVAGVACGGKSDTGTTTPVTKPVKTTPEPGAGKMATDGKAAIAAQIEAGGKVFGESCSGCHGDKGQGKGKALALIGDAALPKQPVGKRTVTFSTAADVLAYISKAMPKDEKGSLSADKYAAVLAYMLSKSGRALEAKLDATTAAKIVLNQ